MNTLLQQVTVLTGVLSQGQVAIPLIVTAIMAIRTAWKQSGQPDVTDAELIDAMERQFRANLAYGQAEIDRLKALVAADQGIEPPA